MKNVLLVIDPQVVYFQDGPLQVADRDLVVTKLILLIRNFKGRVFVAQHETPMTPFHFGMEPWELHPEIKALNDYYDLIPKTGASCFFETSLSGQLALLDAEINLSIAGFQSHHCNLATALDSAARGHETTIITDAVSSPAVGEYSGEAMTEMGILAATQLFCGSKTTYDILQS